MTVKHRGQQNDDGGYGVPRSISEFISKYELEVWTLAGEWSLGQSGE